MNRPSPHSAPQQAIASLITSGFFLVFFFLSSAGRSYGSDTISLHYPRAEVESVLAVYERLSGPSVFAALDLNALVTVETAAAIPKAAAIDLIQTTLLERYGIQLSLTSQNETLARWSKDPRYPRRSDEPMSKDERDVIPKAKIRSVKP